MVKTGLTKALLTLLVNIIIIIIKNTNMALHINSMRLVWSSGNGKSVFTISYNKKEKYSIKRIFSWYLTDDEWGSCLIFYFCVTPLETSFWSFCHEVCVYFTFSNYLLQTEEQNDDRGKWSQCVFEEKRQLLYFLKQFYVNGLNTEQHIGRLGLPL